MPDLIPLGSLAVAVGKRAAGLDGFEHLGSQCRSSIGRRPASRPPGGDPGGAFSRCQFASTSPRIDTDKTEPRDRSATKSSPTRTNPTRTNPTRTNEPTKPKSPADGRALSELSRDSYENDVSTHHKVPLKGLKLKLKDRPLFTADFAENPRKINGFGVNVIVQNRLVCPPMWANGGVPKASLRCGPTNRRPAAGCRQLLPRRIREGGGLRQSCAPKSRRLPRRATLPS